MCNYYKLKGLHALNCNLFWFVCLNGVKLSAIFQLYCCIQFLFGGEAGIPGENPRPAVAICFGSLNLNLIWILPPLN